MSSAGSSDRVICAYLNVFIRICAPIELSKLARATQKLAKRLQNTFIECDRPFHSKFGLYGLFSRHKNACFDEFIYALSAHRNKIFSKLFELEISIEPFMQLLHIAVLALLVNAAHLHEVVALVVEETHHVLKRVFAQSLEDGQARLSGHLGAS